MNNFTMADILGTLWALPFFALVFLAPGYLVGRVLNVLEFRRRGVAEQWLWSMGLSLVVTPISVNLLSRFLPLAATTLVFWALAVAAMVDVLWRWRSSGWIRPGWPQRTTLWALGLCAVWLIVCLVSLPDIQWGGGLYSTSAVADLGVRNAFVAAAMHGGAPPASPFLHPGHAVPLRYYYYWYVVTALPGVAAGVAPRAALFASSVWSGWLLATLIPLVLKHLLGVRRNLRRASIVGIALLALNGLDCLPVLWAYVRYHIVYSDIEVWDSDEVSSWTNSLLWVPHHVAAVAVCALSFTLLWHATRDRLRPSLAILAAFGLASAAGLSVYVTFAFALFLIAAAAYWLCTKRFRTVGVYAGVGVLLLALSAGYLRDLRSVPQVAPPAAANAVAADAVRVKPSGGFAGVGLRQLPPGFANAVQIAVHHNKLANIAVRPFLLVPVLFLEFGLFGLVGIRQARLEFKLTQRHATEAAATRDLRWMLWLMLLTSLFVATMLHSKAISNNDLAMRGVEVAQFVLLLWAAMQLAGASLFDNEGVSALSRFPKPGWLAGSLLALGLVTTVVQLASLRFYLWGADHYGWTNPVIPASELTPDYGSLNLEIRSAYAALDRKLPRTAVVDFGASPKLNLQQLYYSRYQQSDGMSPDCDTDFGGSLAACRALEAHLAPIFGTPFPPPVDARGFATLPATPVFQAPQQVFAVCKQYGISAILLTFEDPVFHLEQTWFHGLEPIYASNDVAAYLCRPQPTAP